MFGSRSSGRILIYLILSVILPIGLMLVNHLYKPDNIFISIILIAWMGFALLALQPYSTEEYKTTEP